MADRQTGQIYANNHAMYLVYTDRFKYMGAFEYVEVRDRESLIATMKDNDIKQLVVTDGPNYMCVINEKTTLGE